MQLEQVYNLWFDVVWSGHSFGSAVTFVEQNESLTPLIANEKMKNERVIMHTLRETIADIKVEPEGVVIDSVMNGYFVAYNYSSSVDFKQLDDNKIKITWNVKWKASKFSIFGTKIFSNWLQTFLKNTLNRMNDVEIKK